MRIKKFNESNDFTQDELKEKFQQLIDEYSEKLTPIEFSNAIVEVLEMFYHKHSPKNIEDIDKEDTYAKQLLMSMRKRIDY
jgi:uncharacterized membrane protein YgaE (UPF0421/DUF939 family)